MAFIPKQPRYSQSTDTPTTPPNGAGGGGRNPGSSPSTVAIDNVTIQRDGLGRLRATLNLDQLLDVPAPTEGAFYFNSVTGLYEWKPITDFMQLYPVAVSGAASITQATLVRIISIAGVGYALIMPPTTFAPYPFLELIIKDETGLLAPAVFPLPGTTVVLTGYTPTIGAQETFEGGATTFVMDQPFQATRWYSNNAGIWMRI